MSQRKQQYTAKRIFMLLRDEPGFDGGYMIVKDYVRGYRRRRLLLALFCHPFAG